MKKLILILTVLVSFGFSEWRIWGIKNGSTKTELILLSNSSKSCFRVYEILVQLDYWKYLKICNYKNNEGICDYGYGYAIYEK